MAPRIDPKDLIKDGVSLSKLDQNKIFIILILCIFGFTFYYQNESNKDSIKELEKNHREQVQSLIDKLLQNCRPENISNNNNNLFKN